MGKYDGKVVLITGASSGIGAATAVEFAKQGAKVAITGRNEERLAAVAKECRAIKSCHVLEMIADMSDFDKLETLVNKTVEKFGGLDILVNNAAYGILATLDVLSKDQYENLFQANLRAPIFLSKYALPHLKKTKGCIINISSIASIMTMLGNTSYATTKAALDHFSRNLAAECVQFGVRVNVVNPGLVATRFADALDLPAEVKQKMMEDFAKQQPLGVIQPVEIAEGILFLASASKITGICLVIDGGMLIRPH